MKKNAEFLKQLFRHDTGPGGDQPDPAPVDPTDAIPADAAVGRGTIALLRSVDVAVSLADGDLHFEGDQDVINEGDDLLTKYSPAIRAALAEEVEQDDPPRRGRIEVDGVAWVERPDRRGRPGWEPVGLRQDDRWWSRSEYGDLPAVPVNLGVGSVPKPAETPE